MVGGAIQLVSNTFSARSQKVTRQNLQKPNFKNLSFQANQAEIGGAIQLQNSELIITNSTFSDNFATMSSGSIDASASFVEISESNFYVNSASEGGSLSFSSGSMYLVNQSEVRRFS